MAGGHGLILTATAAAAATAIDGVMTTQPSLVSPRPMMMAIGALLVPMSHSSPSSSLSSSMRELNSRNHRQFSTGSGHAIDHVIIDCLKYDDCRNSFSPGIEKMKFGSHHQHHHHHYHHAIVLNSLLQIRGGEEEDDAPFSFDYLDDINDDVTAEELLDSIFALDDEHDNEEPALSTTKLSKSTSLDDRNRSKSSRPTSASTSAKRVKKSKSVKANHHANTSEDEDEDEDQRRRLEQSVREKAATSIRSVHRYNNKANLENGIDLDGMMDDAAPKRGPDAAKLTSNSLVNQIRSMERESNRDATDNGIQANKYNGSNNNKMMNGLERWHGETTSEPNSDDQHGRQTTNASPPPTTSLLNSNNEPVRAVWGPNAQYRGPKSHLSSGSSANLPPPPKATSDERRLHERHVAIEDERQQLLSDLALTLHDSRVSAVQSLIRGNAAHVPPALFGQSIAMERAACDERWRNVLEDERRRREERHRGELLESPSMASASSSSEGGEGGSEEEDENGMDVDTYSFSPDPSFRHIEDPALLSYWGLTPNAKLYGGAQYHRVLRYYHHLFLTVPLPPITDDEVALLTDGIAEVHDASDLLRAVSLLVRHKMELVAEDVLADMTRRLLYVMDRQWEMVDYSMALHRPMGGSNNGLGKSGDKARREAELYRRHGAEYCASVESDLKAVLEVGFRKFAEERAAEAHDKSLEDVRSLLRYITWDMGRARGEGRAGKGRRDQGFVSQIEIVSSDHSADGGGDDQSAQAHEGSHNGRETDVSRKKTKKKDKKSATSGHSNSRMVARGGAGSTSGSGRSKRASKRGAELNRSRHPLRTKGGDMSSSHHDEEEEMGDLIGGVMNRGTLDDAEEDDATASNGGNNPSPSTSTTTAVASSKTSPVINRDDEVLNVLLDTVSSALVPKSDVHAAVGMHTRAAIEGLVSYVTDRTRMDMSRIVRSKFNTFFLLAFHEELGSYLRREVDAYLATQCLDG